MLLRRTIHKIFGGGWCHKLKTSSFHLCQSYLKESSRTFASLLALGAFVDIAGTVIVTHLVAAGRIPQLLLETIIVTIPLVIFSHLFGTLIGMQRPVKILTSLAIPIWFFYVPASLVIGIIANCTKWVAKKFGSDPGY
jgi:CBS domain containing-hemolysin-like protein